MGDRNVRVLRGRHRAARGQVLDCKRTMVQNVPVLRGLPATTPTSCPPL